MADDKAPFGLVSQTHPAVAILTQFVLRLSFGLALGMALTDPKKVTSGYYRNHLYVLLGLTVLATMVALGAPQQFELVPPLAAAVLSYVSSVAWLYEKPRIGIPVLWLVAACTLWAPGPTCRRPQPIAPAPRCSRGSIRPPAGWFSA